MHSTIPGRPFRKGVLNAPPLTPAGLVEELRGNLDGEVRFDSGSRSLYSTDSSNYRQVPIGVVIPRTIEDVVETVAICRRYGVPILSRGGGTSLAGQCCNAAVVLDFSKYLNRVLEVDPERRIARVQPGCVLDNLRAAAAPHGLTFGPDPATHSHNTLGGMIGNDSCGVHSVMAEFYGPGARTSSQVVELEVLTYDGLRLRVGKTADEDLERIIREGGRRAEIYAGIRALRDRHADQIRERFPDIPRRVSGYSLPHLLPEHGFNVARALTGSEGTLVVILEATVSLIPNPRARSLLVLGYPSVFEAGDHVAEIRNFKPIGLEGFDRFLVNDMKKKHLHVEDLELLPEGQGFLMVEFGADSKEQADARAGELMDALRSQENAPSMRLVSDRDEEKHLWTVRESGLGATARVPGDPDTWPGWEDSAVPPDRVGLYLRDLRALFDKYGYQAALYGHFGQGCIHCRVTFDLASAGGIEQYRRFVFDAADLVVRHGGSISGEHGDGQARGELLPRMYGDELVEAFRAFKSIWDPDWKMNPGKVVDPYPLDSNLRIGSDYRPAQPETHFHFPEDDGSLARGVLRCVGVGECRRESGGTMCPSYMVTREEMHSTRGRSRLLFEMLQGEVIQDGWRDEHVREALDLCLACKGCKGDCPINVDMATYKAEFLSHYYAGRLRPRTAYSMGLIYWWARLASHFPQLVNFVSHAPGLSRIIKELGGIAPEREVPRFAPETLRDWFGRRRSPAAGKPVLLWPDTFTNHFHPEAGKAAVEVLEDAGYRVEIPERSLCCGRPLYDFGMLDLAQRQLRQVLDVLHPRIAAGVPVVGLEPSCVAVFRDELVNLFPNDEDARRLSRQTFLLSELLMEHTPGYSPPKLNRRAVVHGHCHHKAIMGMKAEADLLARMELDFEILDSGCCGMAGSFGFEAEHYDVSTACGERALLPAVRNANADTLLITDGFSCRQQIEQTTGRRALHVAEVLRMGLRLAEGKEKPAEATGQREPGTAARTGTALLIGAAIGGGILLGRSAARRFNSLSHARSADGREDAEPGRGDELVHRFRNGRRGRGGTRTLRA